MLVSGAPKLVSGAPKLVLGAPKLVSEAPKLVPVTSSFYSYLRQNVPEAKYPRGKMSLRRFVPEAKCPRGKMSEAILSEANLSEAKCPATRDLQDCAGAAGDISVYGRRKEILFHVP